MAVSKAGQQVTFSSANFLAVSGDSQTTSDAITLSSNSVAAQITLKSDHSGSPLSGDTVDFYILYSTGDPDGSTTDMQPDVIYIKRRDTSGAGQLYDDSRGATIFIPMDDSTDAEETASEGLTAFNSDGFTCGSHNGNNNASGTYVAYCWKESATAGFDFMTWAGNETQKTISHSLSAVPHWIAVKVRGTAKQFTCYHHKMDADPDNAGIFWQSTAVPTTGTAGYFGNTAPTSSVFTVGTSTNVNQNSDNVMGYVWTSIQGFSKFGSYTGNGNADGTFVYTGFRPAFVLFKQSSAAGEKWYMFDSKRNPFNLTNELLMANVSDAESVNTTGAPIDILSNGFKIRGTDAAGNASGSTYIYMTFAEAPFVNSNGVPCNAR